MSETIIILDFGSQYTQVIARRIRECQVYSKVLPFDTPVDVLKSEPNLKGIILSGGPRSVLETDSPRPDKGIFELGVPVMGICYGLQLMGIMLGGRVECSEAREYGHGRMKIFQGGELLHHLEEFGSLRVWNSHGDHITQLPEGFKRLASTENSEFAVIEDSKRRFYGLQFHPEVAHSERGLEIIKNFLFTICGCTGDWVMKEIIDHSIEEIKKQVGDKHVILGLSGGVDSSVAAALIHRAIGKQLTCVFVDNGLLRQKERALVEKLYGDHFHVDLRVVDASDHFLGALAGVTDPEQKRKIIGRVFIEVFDKAVESVGDVDFLAQGTLYPDIIESVPIAGNPASMIKSHHNVGGLPENMKLKLLEPLRELFKDEVRALGEALGLPHEVVWRHPFPGPGLAVRVMGEIKKEYLEILRKADAILQEEMVKTGYYDKVWQSFCVFLPIKTVGVMGDERTYDYVIALRIVESQDAMTADWARVPHDVLGAISTRIINEVAGVNRVVLDISSKPPATIEWE
ncbi:MAG: glutamine-hydrolyzing GMP synthase [Verrucomicrobia bacterium CG_4_10_14_3_um_filter_43_23]|nr:MAG: glutamine-hydrolyzing GMP synthase [Verrucomicrobia bacterium CG1_02_43_26]PIP59469.1 MAG: glutamine-hydrolyzing GMP synthase [Verrucomicrobia bacterium CG22_combo_CG10-13_8_21_14_all_43_17]PIX58630.1 MAG: glutamine-hydrolyzing GMP synthase [Verrucomicrobia bacterium CG_4_10_14_3_um_filter_43_23]PIY61455.1 MAG: glutamine-hydrolyzing GMP synthase [Verrucomicrobia bacterium CG_4_10_14_0_8_um_filter_43_34]PJA43822.1 MAG: glutamine-hydrolyzing GMP synthase [Verrucomicrobia bacterium CG_4_9_